MHSRIYIRHNGSKCDKLFPVIWEEMGASINSMGAELVWAAI